MRGEDKQGKRPPKVNTSAQSNPGAEAVPAAGTQRSPPLAADIQVQIGRRLLAAYDDVLQQPVPDRFRQLLDKLDETSAPAADTHKAAKPSGKGDTV